MLAVVLALGVVAWYHAVNTLVLGEGNTLTGHAQYILLGAMLSVPFAVVAIGAAERVSRWSGPGSTWRDHTAFAAAVSLIFGALLVPLSIGQMWIQELLVGGGGAHAHHGELVGARLAELAGYGVQYALIAQPVAFALTLAVVGLSVSKQVADPQRRRKARVAFVAMATALVTTSPLSSASASLNDVGPDGTGGVTALAGSCDTAPQRVYDVTAINVDIVVDRWGDHDPFAFMYALNSEIQDIRTFEDLTNVNEDDDAANEEVVRVANGLDDDPIQPLVMRGRLGDCIVVNLTNGLTQGPIGGPGPGVTGTIPVRGTDPGDGVFDFSGAPDGALPGSVVPSVSIDVQGVAFEPEEGGGQVGLNDGRMVAPGQTKQYKFYLDPLMGEGAKVFHSGGEAAQLTAHGLFGAIVAEPAGSRWYDPRTGEEKTNDQTWNSWDAMIQPFTTPSFREFVIMYHEFGGESFNMRQSRRDSDHFTVRGPDPVRVGSDPATAIAPGQPSLGWPVPMLDLAGPSAANDQAASGIYRPASKAINYRSEPFWRRLRELNFVFGDQERENVVDRGNEQNDGVIVEEQMHNKKGLGYSSYVFGDPATPIPTSYLGEPTKTRLLHPGSQQLHVHHLHGGADRWRANPNADDPTAMFGGPDGNPLDKDPNNEALSIRIDSQTVGPDESYNLEHECGAGGCQQAAGDFLFHCHIAHHYIAGMWSFWRVLDTDNPGVIAPLPDRAPSPAPVTSDQLIGQTFEGKTVVPDDVTPGPNEITLSDWVEPQLPPQGVRLSANDATVWDWIREGNVYKGEPASPFDWPDFDSPDPDGQGPAQVRPDILFNPSNGRYAWPLFKPHLGQRPPFSPNGHTGAPWTGERASPERPDGMCPADAPTRDYEVVAKNTEIQMTDTELDRGGMVFTLADEKNDLTPDTVEPLTIRSNVGDCVELTLTSELVPVADAAPGSGIDGQNKINIHTHFVQFDPQASDGVITGFSYEQSVRNYLTEGANGQGRQLQQAVQPGDTEIVIDDLGGLVNPDGTPRLGVFIAVGQGTRGIEIREIVGMDTATGRITLDEALANPHPAGQFAGVEFVQYLWYSDVDSGTVFFHDHVAATTSWAHGLVGAHIIEPAGSRWLDPETLQPIRSGTRAVIDVQPGETVGVDHADGRDFREFMMFLGNGRRGRDALNRQPGEPPIFQRFNTGQDCEEASINLRAEPLSLRSPDAMERLEWNGGFCRNPGVDNAEENPNLQGEPSSNETFTTVDPHVFSSVKYGDPATPLLEAYAGDPVVIRQVGVSERIEALRFQGHRFRFERFNMSGQLFDTTTTGISERADYILDGGAGGPNHVPGDYLYYSSRNFAFVGGGWGIFRVYGEAQGDLPALPDRSLPSGEGFPRQTPAPEGTIGPDPRAPTAADDGDLASCPTDAPVRRYDVSIFNLTLPTGPNVDPDPANDGTGPGQNADAGVNRDRSGVIYSLSQDMARIQANPEEAQPLVLRANVGECVEVTLHNEITDDGTKGFDINGDGAGDYAGDMGGPRAGFSLAKLNQNVQQAGGAAVGLNPDTTVARGDQFTYRFFADRDVGTSIFQNLASPASLMHGAYGLFITEPVGSQWFNSETGERIDDADENGVTTETTGEAIIRANFGLNSFREFAVTMGSTDQHTGRSVVPYWEVNAGTGEASRNGENPRSIVAIGGAFEPTDQIVQDRIQPGFNRLNYHTSSAIVNSLNSGGKADAYLTTDPDNEMNTPIFRAEAGDRTVFRVGAAATNTFHTFFVGGHVFPWEPFMWDDRGDFRSQLLTARAITAGHTLDVELVGGAGTQLQATGDYMFGDARDAFTRAGMWGILRVVPPGQEGGPAPL